MSSQPYPNPISLLVRIPRLAPGQPDPASSAIKQFWQEMKTGFRLIWAHAGLRGLTVIYTGMSFFGALTWFSILPAMILARTGGDELTVAYVQGALVAAGVGRSGKSTACCWARLSHLPAATCFFPNEAIWQSKIQPAVQGRVFAVKHMVGHALMMLGYLPGGVLADSWFEPAMQPGGVLVSWFGGLIAPGPGGGMALMFLLTAIAGAAMSLAGYIPAIRTIEADLPDHDFELKPAVTSQTSLG